MRRVDFQVASSDSEFIGSVVAYESLVSLELHPDRLGEDGSFSSYIVIRTKRPFDLSEFDDAELRECGLDLRIEKNGIVTIALRNSILSLKVLHALDQQGMLSLAIRRYPMDQMQAPQFVYPRGLQHLWNILMRIAGFGFRVGRGIQKWGQDTLARIHG